MDAAPFTDLAAQTSLERLLPRIQARCAASIDQQPVAWAALQLRLAAHFPRLFGLLYGLYAQQYDFFYHLEELLVSMAEAWFQRSEALRALDAQREANPDWFAGNQMMGGVLYVDLFAGDLQKLRRRIPYFKEMGLTYLHLMPLFETPLGENDGGYAVSSYRRLNPQLGDIAQLTALAQELQQEGISLVLDLVFNHTSNEHEWAVRARQGETRYLDYYRTFPDRRMPDAYERNLREIFPEEHPGAFTYFPDMQRWVWTTFHSYQWDLNYANPEVFARMAGEMLFLANVGVQVLRLDAVAFIWKELGTNCENLPQAHQLIQAFNAVARIAAPALTFKSEAIVHPDEVVRYISPDECQLSYNPLLMALAWNSLATRCVDLLKQALSERFKLPRGTAWVNYVRCHDDIGWTFSDEDAARLGVNGYDHRRFLNDFYTGRFEGSFALGLPFQENPKTGDMRISGMCASLAGLEKALLDANPVEVELSIRRILLLHTLIITVGGVPLLYLGDEWATCNDYSFRSDPAKANDSRWVHRPFTDWSRYPRRLDPSTPEGRVYQGLLRLIQMRREHPVFGPAQTQVIDTGSPHVLGFARRQAEQNALVFANFSEHPQTLPANLLRLYGLSFRFTNLLSGENYPMDDIFLAGCDTLILEVN